MVSLFIFFLRRCTSCFIQVLVYPKEIGGVAIQDYNSLFTLSHIYPITDAIPTVFEIDVENPCAKESRYAMPSLNASLADSLMYGALLPCTLSSRYHMYNCGQRFKPSDVFLRITSLCSSKEHKMIQVGLEQLDIVDMDIRHRKDSFLHSYMLKKCGRCISYQAGIHSIVRPAPKTFHVENQFYNRKRRAISFMCNSLSVAERVKHLVDRCRKMWKCKAHIHHFITEGLDVNEVETKLAHVESIMHAYQELHT